MEEARIHAFEATQSKFPSGCPRVMPVFSYTVKCSKNADAAVHHPGPLCKCWPLILRPAGCLVVVRGHWVLHWVTSRMTSPKKPSATVKAILGHPCTCSTALAPTSRHRSLTRTVGVKSQKRDYCLRIKTDFHGFQIKFNRVLLTAAPPVTASLWKVHTWREDPTKNSYRITRKTSAPTQDNQITAGLL